MCGKVTSLDLRSILCVFLLVQVAKPDGFVYFSSNPVTQGVTEKFNITCEINDRRSHSTARPLEFGQVGSIFIYSPENGGMIAFVSNTARNTTGGRNLPFQDYTTVNGDLKPNSSIGYVSVVWEPAPTLHSPKFQCQIFGFDKSGMPMDVFINHEADFETPTIEDLVGVLRALKGKIADVRKESAKVLQGRVPHSEMGRIQCSTVCGCKEITFNQSYQSTPDVTYAPVRLDIEDSRATRFVIRAQDISKTGFTLCSETWGDTQVYGFAMNWFAIGI